MSWVTPVSARIAVVAVGARSPLGLSAQQTAYLYRTGAAAMNESPLRADGDPVAACFDPTLSPELSSADRVATLGASALDEVLEALRGAPAKTTERVDLMLCLDPLQADGGADGIIAQRLARRVQAQFGNVRVHMFDKAEGGGGAALLKAIEKLESRRASIVLLGGVHSDMGQTIIDELVAKRRLMVPDNIEAVIPGEAAAFVALVAPHTQRALDVPALAAVCNAATAMEQARPDNDYPAALAQGLTEAMHQATRPLVDASLQAGWLLTDYSHEAWRVLELQSVSVRAKDVFGDPNYIDAPVHRLGSLGAAAMPMFLVLTSVAWRSGFAPHPLAIALVGSDSGERAAALLCQVS